MDDLRRPRPKRRSPKLSNIDGFLHPRAHHKPAHVPSPASVPVTHKVTDVATRLQPASRILVPAYSPVKPTPKPQLHKKKPLRKRLGFRIVSVIAALIIGAGGIFAWRNLSIINKLFHGNVISDAQALFGNTKLKGEDRGRVNILLAGNSADDPGHSGAELTDSIMIVSIDTQNHTGFMLSIPRDLWVYIPGWSSHQKINASNEVTAFSQDGFPKGGMGQLEEIIQDNLGIPIDYYALIDYTAFRDAVNAVGGISVNIQSTDSRGLFDPNIGKWDGGPLRLSNGQQTLNGQTALNLARARGDPCGCGQYAYGFNQGDFDRTQHQRQMLVALQQKASSAGVLANPIKISQLFNAVGNNAQTDMKLPEILRAVQLTKGMNIANLQSLTLSESGSKPLLKNYMAPNGQAALIPTAGIDNFSEIQQYYLQISSNNPVVKESPSVVVLNASDVTGLAHKEATVLQGKGFVVPTYTDANNLHPGTMIVDNTNGQKPASKQLLQQLFPGTIVNSGDTSTEAKEARYYTSADFVIILGQNWNSSQTTSN